MSDQQLPYSVHRRQDFPALCVEGGFECRVEWPDGYALTVKTPNALDCIREADRLSASLNAEHGVPERTHRVCNVCGVQSMGFASYPCPNGGVQERSSCGHQPSCERSSRASRRGCRIEARPCAGAPEA